MSNLNTGVFAGGQAITGTGASFYNNGNAPQTDRPNYGNASVNHGRKQSQAIPDLNQTAPEGTLIATHSPERTNAENEQNLKLPNI